MMTSRGCSVALVSLLLSAPAALAEPMALQLANGDTIHVEKVAEESNDTVTVVIHPQLGRLEVSSADLQHPAETPAWSSTLAAGVIGVSEDNDDSLTVSMNATSSYTKAADKLVMKGGLNYKKTRDQGDPIEIDTEKGSASIRYDRKVNESVNWFTSGNYDYNGLNDVSINTLKAAMGAGFPVLKTDSTELILSVGPSLSGAMVVRAAPVTRSAGTPTAVARSPRNSPGFPTVRSS